MRSIAKKAASVLPNGMRDAVQRSWYSFRIKTGDFKHTEPEFARMSEWVSPGDVVLDIGANLGIYTSELSRLVGPSGRVIAFEPVPVTFRFLVHNSRLFPHPNISFFNLAISSSSQFFSVDMPINASGLPALARASMKSGDGGGLQVMSMSLDQMKFPKRVSFVKIDVEGHEPSVLEGMTSILKNDRPTWVIEGMDAGIHSMMTDLGYRSEIMPNSPNTIFMP